VNTSTALSSAPVAVPAGEWNILPQGSTASFSVRNLGVNTVRGTVPIRAATVVVAADRLNTQVRATLDLAGIDTGNARRDKDLRSRRLLDTEQFPAVTFVCADVVTTEDGWRLAGTLEAHGATIPVTVEAQPTNASIGSLAVRATATFDRRALGVRAPRFMIGREIVVEINAEFRASGGQRLT